MATLMRSLLVVVSTPSLAFSLRVVEAHEPVRVQAFGAELAVEGLDEGVVGRFARPREVEDDAALIGPQIEIARHELAALIEPPWKKPSTVVQGLGAVQSNARLQSLLDKN